MLKFTTINQIGLWFVAVAVLFLPGCSGENQPADMPRLYPIEITVIAEGAPVENAGIGLHSMTPDFKWTVGGITDAQGKAVIVTHGRYIGAPEGEYAVTVEKVESERYDPENPPLTIRIYSHTQPEYTDPEKTPLRITVTRKSRSEALDVGKLEKTVLRIVPTN